VVYKFHFFIGGGKDGTFAGTIMGWDNVSVTPGDPRPAWSSTWGRSSCRSSRGNWGLPTNPGAGGSWPTGRGGFWTLDPAPRGSSRRGNF